MNRHFWFNQWLNDEQLDDAISLLNDHITKTLSKPFPFDCLMQALKTLNERLITKDEVYKALYNEAIKTTTPEDVEAMMGAITEMLKEKNLKKKIRLELGTSHPGFLSRLYPTRYFEAWMPMGCVVHVMPANVFSVGALGLVESLTVGNINIVKISEKDSDFTAIFADALCRLDTSGLLKDYIAVVKIPASQPERLKRLFGYADAISAWGGERAISAIKSMTPDGVRLIVWGHKISFGYVADEIFTPQDKNQSPTRQSLDDVVNGVARDVCRLDQQACSSPQTVFVEIDSDESQALRFAEMLFERLKTIAPTIPAKTPDTNEQAEITTVVTVARAEEALGLTKVFEDTEGRFRVIYDKRGGLSPSPLYRTIWVKPIRRDEVLETIRPMRAWLQSCGLACDVKSLATLSRLFYSAGVTRICRVAEMVDSYIGSPHDGVYELQQLTKRVTLDAPYATNIGSISEFDTYISTNTDTPKPPVLTKKEFQARSMAIKDADLVVRSGGSSGQTVYSRFSWDDYHLQMHTAAHGLVAAGLDPEKDRVINLFAAGHLYGGFISFWSILEYLKVPMLPMALVEDYDEIAQAIIDNDANVLIGAPSHILGLFNTCGDRLKGKITKVFYGGERISDSQMEFLRGFGVSVIRSAVYGSNDAGPMGYQCQYCKGTVHHLIRSLQHLEIVDLDDDKPVERDGVGRFLFTSKARQYPQVIRYEIGDTGRWIDKECPCGRKDPLFEIVGRTGDVFKAGGPFFNYRRFVDILDSQLNYTGPVQIHIKNEGAFTVLEVWILEISGITSEKAREVLIRNYGELEYCLSSGLSFKFDVKAVPDSEIQRVSASGKIKPICDHRG
ncbi:MAG: hypothetical protein N3A62_06850 [Thermodesulfovibrionales bacterium]|nr:hypothetical protein [Thermodesulfovibrionales bacterium]